MAALPGHRPAPKPANGSPDPERANSSAARRRGRPSRAGRRPLTPPRSPLTRCLVSPSSCSKPRGRAWGFGAEGRSQGRHRRCRRSRDPRVSLKPPRAGRPCLCGGRSHGNPDALPQLRRVQLLAPASGAVHSERAPRQNPKDSGQRRQPRPSR